MTRKTLPKFTINNKGWVNELFSEAVALRGEKGQCTQVRGEPGRRGLRLLLVSQHRVPGLTTQGCLEN